MISDEQIKVLTAFLKPRMGKKRFLHSANVAYEARKLAKRYGADEDKAFVAGYLHDCAKELDAAEQRRLAEKCSLAPEATELAAPPLLHAIAGAVAVKDELHINDDDIYAAIRYHTTGAPEMSLLGKIIYLADLVSEDRDYKDVKRMRKIAYEDIDEAMLEALKFSISDSIKKENSITRCTWLAYNEYADKLRSVHNSNSKKK